jgi:CheY-like chemotaxis protein
MKELSVLVVEDNAQNLKLTRVLLVHHGYDVQTAMDAEQALELLRSFHPRVILMDIQLPGMDGLALTRRLKSDPQMSDIIIIALTAYAMDGDADRARAAGCDGYVSKPFDTRLLPEIVASCMKRSERRLLH